MTIVRTVSDLPNFVGESTLILDFETSSRNQKLDSLNPWKNCWIGGTGLTSLTAAKSGEGYYVPTGHLLGDSIDGLQNRAAGQLDDYIAAKWLYDQLQGCDTIIGHNINYDMHALVNNWGKYFDFKSLVLRKNWIDTMTFAKLVDSDLWSYSLAKLSTDWLHREKGTDELAPYLKTKGGKVFNRDFSQIPIDICGEYCIQDILLTAELSEYCKQNIPAESATVWKTEQEITKILFKIEHRGMRIDLQRLATARVYAEIHLSTLQQEICELLTADGCQPRNIRPGSNEDCFEVICAYYGLPVLAWTPGGKGGKNKKPSFDKHALGSYLYHPEVLANERLKSVIKKILEFRRWDQINNTFLKPYEELQVGGVLHGSFNQVIRTGRMSMRTPNMQQCPLEVRYLVVPYDQDETFRKGYESVIEGKEVKGVTVGGAISNERLVARDASQIEFRLIVNYTRNPAALAAYLNDPNTDYHQMIADSNGIPRKPAKNINFMLSFGGGKYKTLNMLKDALDLLGSYTAAERKKYEGKILHVPQVVWKGRTLQPEMNLTGFESFCWVKAEKTYDGYHSRFPELKKITYRAADIVRTRGWVKNLYGRVRKLPAWGAQKAFNNIIQSSAADLFKVRICELDSYLQSEGLEEEIKITTLVHDEIVTSESVDILQNEKVQSEIMDLLCRPDNRLQGNLDVPILWSKEVGTLSWAECK